MYTLPVLIIYSKDYDFYYHSSRISFQNRSTKIFLRVTTRKLTSYSRKIYKLDFFEPNEGRSLDSAPWQQVWSRAAPASIIRFNEQIWCVFPSIFDDFQVSALEFS